MRIQIISIAVSVAAAISCARNPETKSQEKEDEAPAASAPAPAPAPAPAQLPPDELIQQFHKLWYTTPTTWEKNTWLGIPTQQNPMDVWILQELLFKTKPDFVVECGAFHGGSAALWAMILREINPNGKIISIDIADNMAEARKLPVVKERVEFIIASSTAPETVAKVKEKVKGKKVLLILDSDHSKQHVLNELNAYWDIVPVGGYINVQDSDVNGHPVPWAWGPGPMEALKEFLATNDRFRIDLSQERMLFTMHPNGWLERVK